MDFTHLEKAKEAEEQAFYKEVKEEFKKINRMQNIVTIGCSIVAGSALLLCISTISYEILKK